jgi:ubiquinone/menaquinone biosynthesis C-methylase UbiE
MTTSDHEVLINIYRKRAKKYDVYASLFPLIGVRLWAYRKKAIQELNLQRGDTVIDIGCGSGLNFSLLQEVVGPEGTIIGVDLTDAMLVQARNRVQAKDWKNVRLMQSDAASYVFPSRVDGIISTFALTLVPEFDRVIRNGCIALKPGRRWAIADFKMPGNAFSRLAPILALFLIRPFGGSVKMASRHPWESMEKYLQKATITEYYMGFVYVALGERAESGCG